LTTLPPNGNILSLAETVRFSANQTPRLLVDSSLDDPNRANIDLFAGTLMARHITIGNVLYPGGLYGTTLWSAHVSDDMAFYSKNWPHTVPELPSCLQ
jgi:hypothetical protein